MKRIIFLENEDDYKSSLGYLDKHRDSLKDYIVVNLNSDFEFDYSRYKGLTQRLEMDYVDEQVFAGINEEGFRYASQWFSLKETEPLLTYEDINMGFVMEHFFARAVITALKYLRLIKKIILEEGCKELILVKHNVRSRVATDIVPQSRDKIANDIIHCLKQNLDIHLTEIENLSSPNERSSAPTIDFKDIVRVLMDPARGLFNFFAGLNKRASRRIVMVGNPRLIFPILDAANKDSYKIIYFQKKLAPRVFLDMAKRSVLYKVETDYRLKNENKILSSYEKELDKNRQLLLGNKKVAEFFSFEGINFFPAIKGRIDFAFRVFMPKILKEVVRFKKFIKDEKIDFLVIDEDLKQFARPLILCMNLAAIKSLELLHGLYGYFHTSSLVTTKKAVWGDCLKRHFANAGRIPAEALISTGCPILDTLQRRNKHMDITKVRKDFNIDKRHKIVLFPSRPFKRGAKGGMVGIHIDRIKYESMLTSVIRTLKEFDRIHLIVKLHHNDSSGDYNKEIIIREGYNKPFSVIQNYDIYSLVNASDFLITPASTTIVEAIVLNKPIIMLTYGRSDHLYPFATWKAVRGVDRHNELKPAVEEMLNNYNPGEFEEGRRRILNDIVCGADGKATSRILNIIDELIESNTIK